MHNLSSPPRLKRLLVLGLFSSLFAVAALADPSARVGRIAYLEGDVDFRGNERADSAQASINWPITGGNRMTTAPNARTELRIGSSVIRLDGQSELLITALDDDRLALYLPYGSATVRIRNGEVAREFSLQTPQGQITLLQPGRFRIDAGRDAATASVHMIDGSARFDTPQSGRGGQPGLILAPGSRIDSNNGFTRITSLNVPQATDAFDGWSLARDRNDDRSQSVRYVSAETTGYEELDRNGVWRTTVDYGPVWTPTVVAVDWAPYRSGRWAWVAPWGWTWVDNAPWGYAPSHYGRWVSIDNRWCWAPGTVVARPVWAPAVVGWQGGVQWNQSSWAARPPTSGWFPLAPREVYVPSYNVSRTYVERVNINHVTNLTQINNFYNGHNDDHRHADYRYRAMASTVTPAAAVMTQPPRGTGPQPQHGDGRQQAAQFVTAPGAPQPGYRPESRPESRPEYRPTPQPGSTAMTPPLPPSGSDRDRRDAARFDGRGNAQHLRPQASSVQGQPPLAPQPLQQPLPQVQQQPPQQHVQPAPPMQPIQPVQQVQQAQPQREQSGAAGRQVRSPQQAPQPVPQPAPLMAPVPAPVPAPAAGVPAGQPSPAEHRPQAAGRAQREERPAAPPARPPQQERREHNEPHEGRDRRERQPGA